jgi:hypothetical protein
MGTLPRIFRALFMRTRSTMFSIIFFMHLPVVRTHTPNGGRWITKVTRHLHPKNFISIKEILLASKK